MTTPLEVDAGIQTEGGEVDQLADVPEPEAGEAAGSAADAEHDVHTRPPNHLEGTIEKKPAFAVESAFILHIASYPEEASLVLLEDVRTCEQLKRETFVAELTPYRYGMFASFGARTTGEFTRMPEAELTPSGFSMLWFRGGPNELERYARQAASGTAVIEAFDASGARGWFDVSFGFGDSVKGWFDVPHCEVPW